MSCLASVGLGTNPGWRERVLQLSLACGFMLKSAEARSGDQTVVVCGWVGKEFPDVRQNERRLEFVRVGDGVRAVGQLVGEPTPFVGQ